jgi:hypothetical protein
VIARDMPMLERVDWRVLWSCCLSVLVFAPFAAIALVFLRLSARIETLRGPLGVLALLVGFVVYVLAWDLFKRRGRDATREAR